MSLVANASEATNQITVTALALQFGITFALGTLAVFAFSLLRPKNGVIYERRLRYARAAALNHGNAPPMIEGKGWFTWVKPVWRTSVEDLIHIAGLDAAIYISFLRFCSRFFLFTGVILILILVPIDIVAYVERQATVTDATTFFNAISFYSVRYSYRWIYAHVTMTWIVTFGFFIVMWRYWRQVSAWRQAWMNTPEYQSSVHTRTIMVTGVPVEWRGSEEKVREWLDTAGVDAPSSNIAFAKKLGQLPKLIDQHEKVVREIEKLLEKTFGTPRNLRQDCPPVTHTWEVVDESKFKLLEEKREVLEQQIGVERKRILSIPEDTAEAKSPIAFITFSTLARAHHAARILFPKMSRRSRPRLDGKCPESAHLAPSVKDIFWANAQLNSKTRRARSWSGTLVYIAFLFFGMTLVTLLAGLMNLEHLRWSSPAVDAWARDIPFLFQFIAASITPALLALFFLALPWIFRALSFYQGVFTRTAMEKDVLRKFFLFLVVNNFMFLVGSLIQGFWRNLTSGNFSSIAEQAKRTDMIITQLGTALIDVSSFWMSYILLKGLGALFELAQAFSLLVVYLRRTIFFKHPTPRQLREFARPPDFQMAELYSTHLFAFVVAIMFSIVNPIILIFALVNFFLSVIVYKYQLLYVYSVKTETAGSNWFPMVFNRLIVGVFILQIVMLAATNFALGTTASFALWPLPVITLVFKWIHTKKCHDAFHYIDTLPDLASEETQQTIMGGFDVKKEVYVSREDRYTHRAIHAPLMQVLISPWVAEQPFTRVYQGPYTVDGQHAMLSSIVKYTYERSKASKERRHSLVEMQVEHKELPAIPDEGFEVDSDVDDSDLFEILESEGAVHLEQGKDVVI